LQTLFGGEGRGEEVSFKITPLPDPLPAPRRGEREMFFAGSRSFPQKQPAPCNLQLLLSRLCVSALKSRDFVRAEQFNAIAGPVRNHIPSCGSRLLPTSGI